MTDAHTMTDAHKNDFKAGFARGAAYIRKNPRACRRNAERCYRYVSQVHGTWWVIGFCAALDRARGAYAMSHVVMANDMGL